MKAWAKPSDEPQSPGRHVMRAHASHGTLPARDGLDRDTEAGSFLADTVLP